MPGRSVSVSPNVGCRGNIIAVIVVHMDDNKTAVTKELTDSVVAALATRYSTINKHLGEGTRGAWVASAGGTV